MKLRKYLDVQRQGTAMIEEWGKVPHRITDTLGLISRIGGEGGEARITYKVSSLRAHKRVILLDLLPVREYPLSMGETCPRERDNLSF